MTSTMTLDEYMELVNRCAREKLDYTIPNSSPEHARILIAKLFETARTSIQLITGKLTDTTEAGEPIYSWPAVIENAKQFLRKPGSCLSIISLNPLHHGEQNAFLRALLEDEERAGDIRIHYADEAVKKERPAHFMVTDTLAYRYETDDTKTIAVANFGDAKSAKLLREMFSVFAQYLSGKAKTQVFQPRASVNA